MRISTYTGSGTYLCDLELHDAVVGEVMAYSPRDMADMMARLIETMVEHHVITVAQAGRIFLKEWDA